MRIRLLSERGGHKVGAEIDAPADDAQAAAWLSTQDAERLPDATAEPLALEAALDAPTAVELGNDAPADSPTDDGQA